MQKHPHRNYLFVAVSTITLLCLGNFIAVASSNETRFEISVLGTYQSGIFDGSGAEIAAYDRRSKRLFVTNAQENTVDVLNISNPRQPRLDAKINLAPYGALPHSVAINNRGVVAVAVENAIKTNPGVVVFFNRSGVFLRQLTVGALPDMLTFTSDGRRLLVANEGEPNDDYSVDPEGSVSIVKTAGGPKKIRNLNQSDVQTVDFKKITPANIDPRIRIYGPRASIAQDLEPEHITVSEDDNTAFVSLQENNAIAVIDIKSAQITKLLSLGSKDHRIVPLDASNKDDTINIQNWPVHGMYQPDSIATYEAFGHTFIVTANEGDSRDYDGFNEEKRVAEVTLDPTAFPDAAFLQREENIGRLKITRMNGDIDNDGDFDKLFSYGGRSFSIWSKEGFLVYDSGSSFEKITAQLIPEDFNSNNAENNSFDNRSDDKGAEPQAMAIGKVKGRHYAFIGLERVGGIMVYDITDPYGVKFVRYLNNRNFLGDPEAGTAGDLGPEGIVFIPTHASPINRPLLAVTNEVSGTTTLLNLLANE